MSRASRWAHPRSRGENTYKRTGSTLSPGSSPLTRGKPNDVDGLHVIPGLIPAHAGKTRSARPSHPRGPAHPRSRGENFSHVIRISPSAGSSPLTRGKQEFQLGLQERGRLIPAHAGKTRSRVWSPSPSTAHPRSRGENVAGNHVLVDEAGSSPLTRGKRGAPRSLDLGTGLIPAHAGKTSGGLRRRAPTRAHPRSRGENFTRVAWATVGAGSSPLTRGKPTRAACPPTATGLIPAHAGKTDWDARPWRAVGLIPAHAGKTASVLVMTLSTSAHPRSRGENSISGLIVDRATGSSPLTRGKRRSERRPRRVGGLIPAHAGKTRRFAFTRSRNRAHPRSRGENAAEETAVDIHLGSSPLTRGKPTDKVCGGVGDGLIPAHAGKTSAPASWCGRTWAHPRSRGENP